MSEKLKNPPKTSPLRALLLCGAALFALIPAGTVSANPTATYEGVFTAPQASRGWFYVQPEDTTRPILPGSTVKVTGTYLVPGQKVTLQRGSVVLNETAAVVDEKGAVTISFTLPKDAAPGLHPLVVIFEEPSHAEVIDLRISSPQPLLNEGAYQMHSVKRAPGPYQLAYGNSSRALFVAATQLRPWGAMLQKLDPVTLDVIAEVVPAALPEDQRPADSKNRFIAEPVGPFGIALDETNGTVWVTNTLHNTIAVYAQDDLRLIKQFPLDQVPHARDIQIDSKRERAYVSAATSNIIYVFDTASMEQIDLWPIETKKREGIFAAMGMDIDEASGHLYVTSRRSDELAILDGSQNGKQIAVWPLEGTRAGMAVDYDPASGKAYVVSQDSDNLAIVDVATGKVEHLVTTGGGALSVVFDPKLQLAFVANRAAATITAVTPQGEIVANFPAGPHANHVISDGKGTLFAVNKSANAEDPNGDRISRITPAK